MPNHKSCEKRMRVSARQRANNKIIGGQLRAAVKDLRETTDKEEAQKKYRQVASLYDRAAQRNIIHHRNADRNKSRLARYVSNLG